MVTQLYCESVRVSNVSCRCGISRLCDQFPCFYLDVEENSILTPFRPEEWSELNVGPVGPCCLYIAPVPAPRSQHETLALEDVYLANRLINSYRMCCSTQDLVAADQKIRRNITHTHTQTL